MKYWVCLDIRAAPKAVSSFGNNMGRDDPDQSHFFQWMRILTLEACAITVRERV